MAFKFDDSYIGAARAFGKRAREAKAAGDEEQAKAMMANKASSAIGGALTAVNGVTGILNTALQSANIQDTSQYEGQIDLLSQAGNRNYYDYGQLAEDMSNTDFSVNTDYDAIRGMGGKGVTKEKVGAVGSSTLNGAMTGLQVGGPWGAAIGAVVGAGSAIGGILAGDQKARIQQGFLDANADRATTDAMLNFNAGLEEIGNRRNRFNLANYAAKGGKIEIKKENEGKFTAAAKRHNMTVQEFAKHVLAKKNAGKYSATMRKRANFARNAAGWKHAEGGPIDYSGITTTNNRPYNTEYISYIDSALRNGGLNDYQRAAVLANIIEESGGNPFAEGPGGFYGLLQWSGARYPKTQEKDIYKEIDNQVANILSTATNKTDRMSWTHGGKGSGYNSLSEAMDAYNGKNLADVMKGYTLGYVRPAAGINAYNNRLKVAEQLYNLDGFRQYANGGRERKKEQKLFDSVTNALLTEANNRASSRSALTGLPYEEPLQTEHPAMDAALIYAQPGGAVAKLLAPMTYKGMIQGLSSGEGAQTLLSNLGPVKEIGATRDWLKNFNNTFVRKYHYDPIPLKLSEDPEKAEKAVKDLLHRHNSVVRGIDDFMNPKGRIQPYEKDFLKELMRHKGADPESLEDRLRFAATTYAPSFEGYGRANLVDRRRLSRITKEGKLTTTQGYSVGFDPDKYGTSIDNVLPQYIPGTHYASNSLGTSKGYSYNTGRSALLEYPFKLGPDRNLWQFEADFPVAVDEGLSWAANDDYKRFLTEQTLKLKGEKLPSFDIHSLRIDWPKRPSTMNVDDIDAWVKRPEFGSDPEIPLDDNTTTRNSKYIADNARSYLLGEASIAGVLDPTILPWGGADDALFKKYVLPDAVTNKLSKFYTENNIFGYIDSPKTIGDYIHNKAIYEVLDRISSKSLYSKGAVKDIGSKIRQVENRLYDSFLGRGYNKRLFLREASKQKKLALDDLYNKMQYTDADFMRMQSLMPEPRFKAATQANNKKSDSAFSHYISVGPVGEEAATFIRWIDPNEFNNQIIGPVTRRHTGVGANFLTRNTKAKGGPIDYSGGGELNTSNMNTYNTHGGYFNPGLISIDAGGTHEQNPNGGVQLGVDSQGIPNLVEEGETVYDDYVFSDRLKPSASELKKFNLPDKFAGKTFAELSDVLGEEAKERPNDAISNDGLGVMLDRLIACQEVHKQAQEERSLRRELSKLSPDELVALGSQLQQMSDQQAMAQQGMQQYMPQMEAPMMQQMPVDDQSQMIMPEQQPMMANGGLLNVYKDGTPDKDNSDVKVGYPRYDYGFNLPQPMGNYRVYRHWYPSYARDFSSLGNIDIPSFSVDLGPRFDYGAGLVTSPSDLNVGYGNYRVYRTNGQTGTQSVPVAGNDGTSSSGSAGPASVSSPVASRPSLGLPDVASITGSAVDTDARLRRRGFGLTRLPGITPEGYESIAASSGMQPGDSPSVTSLAGAQASNSDTSDSNQLLPTIGRYAGAVGNALSALDIALQSPDRVRWNRIQPNYVAGNLDLQKMRYTPIDWQIGANQVNANAAATRRAISNAGMGPAVGATLLAANYGNNQNLGNVINQTQLANDQRRAQTIGVNNQAENLMRNFDFRRNAMNTQIANQFAQYNNQLDMDKTLRNIQFENDKYAALSHAISNSLNDISNIGRENFVMNQINSNAALYYGVGANGWAYYKGYDGVDWKLDPQSGRRVPVTDKSEIPATQQKHGGMLKKYKGC